VLFGPSGNFKSFVAVDLALCIATGKSFLGTHAVKQGPVVYIVSEGAYGIKKRIKAWLQKHEQAAPPNFLVIPARFNLQEQDEVVELLRLAEERLGCQPQAIFVDTLTRNFGPGDPNSLRDMQQFCSNLDIIRETTGGTVVVIHHTGWTETSRERSASNLRDDADTSILLKKVEERVVELSCVKQKDFEEFPAYTLKGEAVDLGDDLPEDERWSLVFDYNGTTADRKSEVREAQKDADLSQALRLLSPRREEALDADAVVQRAGLPERTIRRWLEEAYGEQLLLREGTGKRGSPHRYWLSPAGATWLAKVSSRVENGRFTGAGGTDS
jgi:RecA-family ATPase